MKKWLQNIMAGRYGSDELGFTLLLIYLGICIFGIFCDLPLVQLLGLAIILWAFFRILSRNIPARQAENAAYRRFLSKYSAAAVRTGNTATTAAGAVAPSCVCPEARAKLRSPAPSAAGRSPKRPEQTGRKCICQIIKREEKPMEKRGSP